MNKIRNWRNRDVTSVSRSDNKSNTYEDEQQSSPQPQEQPESSDPVVRGRSIISPSPGANGGLEIHTGRSDSCRRSSSQKGLRRLPTTPISPDTTILGATPTTATTSWFGSGNPHTIHVNVEGPNHDEDAHVAVEEADLLNGGRGAGSSLETTQVEASQHDKSWLNILGIGKLFKTSHEGESAV